MECVLSSFELRPGFVGLDDYLDLPRNAETFLIKPLVPTSGAALIFGNPKSGKSWLGIQLALALTGQLPDFLGFEIPSPGRVLYLQLDTPREVWANRFDEMIKKYGLKYDSSLLRLADRESIEHFPFDILQPLHMKYLYDEVRRHGACAVIIDTLREVHSGDEDSSTTSRNVVANLVGATKPAALFIISHDRKPAPDRDKDIMADHRGSSYIVGRMDAILRLTKNRIYYAGRSIEQGDIKLSREENGMWSVSMDETMQFVDQVMRDTSLVSMRSKAKVLAPLMHKTEEACMSMLRRLGPKLIEQQGNAINIDHFVEV